jgi:hypothetical protein
VEEKSRVVVFERALSLLKKETDSKFFSLLDAESAAAGDNFEIAKVAFPP